MATIVFLFDNEEGHLLPSIPLATALERAGHKIVFFSIPDNEDLIKEQGFDFYPIFEGHYPKKFNSQVKRLISENGTRDLSLPKYHIEQLTKASFGELFRNIRPDLFVISCFLSLEALILYYRFGIVPVIFTTYLREPGSNLADACIDEIMRMHGSDAAILLDALRDTGIPLTSLAALSAPLLGFHELVACPKAFDLPGNYHGPQTSYLSAGDNRRTHTQNGFLQEAKPGTPVIYASLGSQAASYGSINTLFVNSMLAVMRTEFLRDHQLILSVGAEAELPDQEWTPTNVRVVKWAPQLDILSVASLAIIHGGLGSIKECISLAVPMIIVPVYRDQPSNARRVEHHGLGRTLAPDQLSAQLLLEQIQFVLKDTHIHNNVRKMQAIFRQAAIDDPGVTLIDMLLARRHSPV